MDSIPDDVRQALTERLETHARTAWIIVHQLLEHRRRLITAKFRRN